MLILLAAFTLTAQAALKPMGLEPPPLAAAECRQLALASPAPTLIIGFEGFAAYEIGGILRLSLLAPEGDRHAGKVEYVSFPSLSILNPFADESAEACAAAWKSVPGKKLMLIGHSYGGQAASTVARELGKRGIAVEDVITLDPRRRFYVGEPIARSPNVRRWTNFYRQDWSGGVPGDVVPGAKNVDLRGLAGHVEMPSKAVVHAQLDRDLARLGRRDSGALAQARGAAASPAGAAREFEAGRAAPSAAVEGDGRACRKVASAGARLAPAGETRSSARAKAGGPPAPKKGSPEREGESGTSSLLGAIDSFFSGLRRDVTWLFGGRS